MAGLGTTEWLMLAALVAAAVVFGWAVTRRKRG
jgi:hypothetical protein